MRLNYKNNIQFTNFLRTSFRTRTFIPFLCQYHRFLPKSFYPPSHLSLFLHYFFLFFLLLLHIHFLKHFKYPLFYPSAIFFLISPHSPSSLTSIHSLFCRLARLEVDPSVCLWLCEGGRRGGMEDEGGADSPSFSRYLIKMAVRANCNYQSLHATTPPCLCVCMHTVRLHGEPRSMCECACSSVLIVLEWIRLISDSPQSPAMTCLPHIPHCPLNTDKIYLPVLACIWNYQMFTNPCLTNADSKCYHAMQTTLIIPCVAVLFFHFYFLTNYKWVYICSYCLLYCIQMHTVTVRIRRKSGWVSISKQNRLVCFFIANCQLYCDIILTKPMIFSLTLTNRFLCQTLT